MPKVELRFQKISDAKRFYEILSNPNFIYFTADPKSVEDEIKWLKKVSEKRKINLEHNYTILYDGEIVGGCGIKIDQHRNYIGEIGYFIDEAYWGKGIAVRAVKMLEKIAFDKLKFKRLTILMNPKNRSSEKVAIKAGYKKEGTMRKAYYGKGKYFDSHLYAKVK